MVRSFDKLLDAIDTGMQEGSNEIGVWVSGFYGSGKSSLTKYLGFALDESIRIDGKPFLAWLQDRMTSTALKARVATVASRHKPAVLMLDLASEQLAGAAMAEISTVLYTKVMQWAGYSRDRKVAHLELMLERDGKLEAFEAEIEKLVPGATWKQAKNQPLVANQLASRLLQRCIRRSIQTRRAFRTRGSMRCSKLTTRLASLSISCAGVQVGRTLSSSSMRSASTSRHVTHSFSISTVSRRTSSR